MESQRGTQTDSPGISEDNGKSERGKTVSYSLFECGECSAVALGVRGDGANLTCHDESMEPVDAQYDTEEVTEHEVSRVSIEIYDYAFENCPVSVTGIAEQLGHDPETVSEHIQSLVEAGFLEERTPELEGGSSVRVYEPRRID